MNSQSNFDFEKMGISEKDAEILKNFAECEKVYILLSCTAADFGRGYATPYVGTQRDGRRLLLMFTSLENARAYINKSGYKKPEGNYMIGRLEKSNERDNVFSVCTAALQFNITGLYVDASAPDAFGCTIEFLFKANNMEVPEVEVLTSNEEMQKKMEENGGKLPYEFNMLPVLNYTNPYTVTQERANEIVNQIFAAGSTLEEAVKTFTQRQNLNENVFLGDVLNKRMIPQAQQEGKEQDVQYFRGINYVLEKTVWERLANEKNLYTLYKKDTDDIFISNGCMYVLYTDLFEHMISMDYRKLSGKDEILSMIEKYGVKAVVVSDGPSKMIVVEEPVIAGRK